MTNVIHADEKQSREGLLFGLDRGRAACPLIVCERGGAGSTGSEGSAGGGAFRHPEQRKTSYVSLSEM